MVEDDEVYGLFDCFGESEGEVCWGNWLVWWSWMMNEV